MRWVLAVTKFPGSPWTERTLRWTRQVRRRCNALGGGSRWQLSIMICEAGWLGVIVAFCFPFESGRIPNDAFRTFNKAWRIVFIAHVAHEEREAISRKHLRRSSKGRCFRAVAVIVFIVVPENHYRLPFEISYDKCIDCVVLSRKWFYGLNNCVF